MRDFFKELWVYFEIRNINLIYYEKDIERERDIVNRVCVRASEKKNKNMRDRREKVRAKDRESKGEKERMGRKTGFGPHRWMLRIYSGVNS